MESTTHTITVESKTESQATESQTANNQTIDSQIETESTSQKTASQSTHKCVSAVFKQQQDAEGVIKQLLDKDISKEHISVMGRNFHTETKISGFITKKDVIVDGLASGALYGSLFGSLLGLLAGVGVLFVPFVGTVVAAGPLGAALLGTTSGALYGALGAGLGSALISLGMPQEKAAIYQTRLQAGEFLLVAEVPEAQAEEIASLLKNAGGEEIATTDMVIPKQPDGELSSGEDISPEMRAAMSDDAQNEFVNTYNKSLRESDEHESALHRAWETIKHLFDRDDEGKYSNRRV